MKTRYFFTAFVLLFISQFLSAQQSYRIDNSNSLITIAGTSNVHDWEMEASGMTAKILLDGDSKTLNKITKVEFSLPTQNIKSHNSIMDKKTWEAMKADKYKAINFKLLQVDNYKVSENRINGIAEGSLNIAGKSQTVSIPFSGEFKAIDKLLIEGSKEIELKDYNIDPPTAMMGTLKTGNKISIIFSLQFVIEDSSSKALTSK